MLAYYPGLDSNADPVSQRRQALLDLLGQENGAPTPIKSVTGDGIGRSISPDASAALSQPGAATTQQNPGSMTPDVSAAGGPGGATTVPGTAGDDGRRYGSQILGLYDQDVARRGGYGGSDPRRQAIASALVSSGNPYAMAAGAVGYLDAWLHRKADTAPTDFSVDDARNIIKNAYQDMFGRAATDQEVQGALTGQGLKPGDRFVGQAGLEGVLGHLGQNAAAERTARAASATAATPDTGAPSTPPSTPSTPSATDTASTSASDTAAASSPSGSTGGSSSSGPLAGVGPAAMFGLPAAGVLASPLANPNVLQNILDQIGQASSGTAWPTGTGPMPAGSPTSLDAMTPTVPQASLLTAPPTDPRMAQIVAEVQRLQNSGAPRDALLAQMGGTA